MNKEFNPFWLFLFLMTVFVGMLYFVSERLWLQNAAFERMASTIDSILAKLSR